MSFIINQKVGKNVYVYECESYWDKEKKQPRQRRKFLGKRDKITGEIVSTKIKERSKPVQSYDFGSTYFCKNIISKLGIKKILNDSIPEKADIIETLIEYIVSDKGAYYLAEQWAEGNYVDIAPKNIASQRISELLEQLGSDVSIRTNFFKKWIKEQKEIEAIYFDITSLSTYSKLIDIAEWGYNRDKEKLRQINIGMVYGNTNELPLFYNIYQGSITDVTTFKNTKKYCNEFGIKKIMFVVDRGFYSKDNIESLTDEKIIIPLSYSTNRAKKLLNETESILQNKNNFFIYKDSIYSYAQKTYTDYKKTFTAHIFRNKEMYDIGVNEFYKQLLTIETKYNNKKYTVKKKLETDFIEDFSSYNKFYKIVKLKKNYILEKNTATIDKQIQKFGTYILITNAKELLKDKILDLYKKKESIEKVFDTMKNDIDRNRLHVHSTERAEGSIFIIYLSLIVTSYIEKVLRKNIKLKDYTKNKIFYELKKLKITRFANGFHIVNELSKKVKTIFKLFDINIKKIEA